MCLYSRLLSPLRIPPARGNAIYDSIITVMVFCAMSAMLMIAANKWLQDLHYQTSARHISHVAKAAEKYITDNYDAYVCQLEPSSCNSSAGSLPVPFTAQTLIDAGYLENGMGTTTPDRQEYRIGPA